LEHRCNTTDYRYDKMARKCVWDWPSKTFRLPSLIDFVEYVGMCPSQ
jgi:hypothetical protein